MREQLLCVLVLLDAAEVFEEALDERPAVLDEAGPQGLEPGVQRPGNTWETKRQSEYTDTHTHTEENRPCSHHYKVLVELYRMSSQM